MARYAHLSEPHPEWSAAAASILLPAAKLDNIVNYRIGLSAAIRYANSKLQTPDPNGVIVTNLDINQDGYTLPLRIYVPKFKQELGEKPGEKFPLLYWSYSGGFCTGNLDDSDVMLRRLSIITRITCASVAYRLAPENPYPAALDDVYAGLIWALDNADRLSVDINKGVLVGGASSGASLSATISRKSLKDDALRGKITGQLLIMPPLIISEAYRNKWKSELLSMEQNKYAMLFSAKTYSSFMEYYLSLADKPENASNPDVYLLLAPSFRDLPPTYIQVAGGDPLRDDGLLYGKFLQEAGVKTKIHVYPGVPHLFHLYAPDFILSKKQDADFRSAIGWLLEGFERTKL